MYKFLFSIVLLIFGIAQIMSVFKYEWLRPGFSLKDEFLATNSSEVKGCWGHQQGATICNYDKTCLTMAFIVNSNMKMCYFFKTVPNLYTDFVMKNPLDRVLVKKNRK